MSDWLRGGVEDFVFTNENVFFEVQKRAGVKETCGISVVVRAVRPGICVIVCSSEC